MKTSMNTYLLMITVLLCTAVMLQAVELCGDDTTDINNGEYTVMNNIWGEGAGEQCIEVNGTGFEITYSTHTNGSQVKAYPVIYKGCHWGHCTADINRNMPIQVGKIDSARFSMSIGTSGAGGTWNAAFEAWFSRTGGGDPANGAELMIWINRGGGAGPGGSQVGTVTIGGASWDVYYADWDWNYIAYIRTSGTSSVSNLDFKAFINDSTSRGYIDTSWYLDAMEAGFEIWADGEGLTLNSYTAAVTGEAMVVIPPEPPPVSETPVTGVWYKVLAGHSGKCMEVADSSASAGANIQQWDDTGGQYQQWMLEAAEESGYYKIVNRGSGMCVQVQDWSTADGGNIQQGTCGSYQNNQQWRLEREGDYYQIINRNSGKLIDVQACSVTNGANLHQWSYYSDGAESQRWSFIRVDGSATQPPSTTPVPATAVPTTPASLGDVNADSNINIVDALLTAQYYVGLEPAGFDTSRADTNCDGTINIVDALLIAQYYVGLVNGFCP
ncbi:MAG: RICIN domain-containing protein [Spirochaetales bacterium]|nr:RICIN domain-containing protein [Spirochaetales bacterium]